MSGTTSLGGSGIECHSGSSEPATLVRVDVETNVLQGIAFAGTITTRKLRRNRQMCNLLRGASTVGSTSADTCYEYVMTKDQLFAAVIAQRRQLADTVEFACGGRARGFVPPSRTKQLRFEAPDCDWATGSGPSVIGTGEAILLAVTGRKAALADLSGDGVGLLAQRVR
jgi:hypothetical protein